MVVINDAICFIRETAMLDFKTVPAQDAGGYDSDSGSML